MMWRKGTRKMDILEEVKNKNDKGEEWRNKDKEV